MKGMAITALVALCIAGQPGATSARAPLPKVTLELVAEGFNAPILLVAPPDGSGRRMLGEQMGVVYVLDADGEQLATPFMDLRDRIVPLLKALDERGLLALAFHPDFAHNGLFYVSYSAKRRPESPFTGKTAYTWRLSEFKVSEADPNRADPASERVLPELYGKLVFGDFSAVLERPSGQLFLATPPASWGALWPSEELLGLDMRLHSLGEDAEGELYLLTTAQGIPVGNTGKAWKLVPAGAP